MMKMFVSAFILGLCIEQIIATDFSGEPERNLQDDEWYAGGNVTKAC